MTNPIQKNENDIKLLSPKIGLTKYIISRFLLVFFILSTYEWISNVDKQVINFFNIYEGSFKYYLLIIVLGIIIFSICTVVVSGVFSLLHAIYNMGIEEVLKKTRFKKIPKFILISPFLIFPLYDDELKIENEYNKYTLPFLTISVILILFIGGSPFINNYKAVYLNYEVYSDNEGNTKYKENQTYVFDKNHTELIEREIEELGNDLTKEDMLYDEPDYDLDYYGTSRNYLFEQTALIEGFKSYRKNYSGFINYISCLIYFFIEKFIVTIICFLLPFLVWIGVSMYRNKN